MSKEEIYYKFIFPTYTNLKTDSVKALYNANDKNSDGTKCVETYEKLNSTLKSYVDYYTKNIPKYFDIRNYAEGYSNQTFGLSLITSYTPEISNSFEQGCSQQSWTKFSYGGKVIYCSLIISSGSFYYNFNLPEEVLVKSKLRNIIVSTRFHSNWYLTSSEASTCRSFGYGNYPERREKRVFNRRYFKPKLSYGIQVDGAVDPPTHYTDLREDDKKDFIDLEVTRRILYNYYDTIAPNNIPKVVIPKIVSGTGENTILSFNPPQEYINKRPMPISYHLLRDSLNERDPYGDCETVLVMWVADSDPVNIENGNIYGLRALNWKQYAIPISVRCCKSDDSYNTRRFLIQYPELDSSKKYHIRHNENYNKNIFKEALYLQDLIKYSNDYIIVYQNRGYPGKNVLDIQRYMCTNCGSSLKALYARREYGNAPNIQQQQNYYILVGGSTYNVNSPYRINISMQNKICIVNKNDTNTIFSPKNYITKDKYSKWLPWINQDNSSSSVNYGWSINDNWFITIFNTDNVHINKNVSGPLSLINCEQLYNNLFTFSGHYCDDLYISSLGILIDYNWNTVDSLKFSAQTCLPLGFLDNHIKIGNTTYGSNTANGIVLGFKNVLDYKNEDLHHFKYNSSTKKYEFVNNTNNTLIYTAYIYK